MSADQVQVLIVVGFFERDGAAPATRPLHERMPNVAVGVTRPARAIA